MSSPTKKQELCTNSTGTTGSADLLKPKEVSAKEQVLIEVEKASPKLQKDFWEIINLRETLDSLNLDISLSLGYLKVAQGKEFETSISTYTQTIKDVQQYFSGQAKSCGNDENLILPNDEIDLLTISKKIDQRREQRDIITSFLSKALGKKFAPPPNFVVFMTDEVIKRWGLISTDKETSQLYTDLLKFKA